jgi:hypothetical protein
LVKGKKPGGQESRQTPLWLNLFERQTQILVPDYYKIEKPSIHSKQVFLEEHFLHFPDKNYTE